MPSSSRWSNTSAAATTHRPEATHLSWSRVIFMKAPWVGAAVVGRTARAGVVGEGRGGDTAVEGAVDDLEFQPGQWLAQALVAAEAEGHVVPGVGP